MSEELLNAWASGFYSAEGYTTIDKVSDRKYVQLALEQMNLEPVEKFREVLGCGTITTLQRRCGTVYRFRTRSQIDIDRVLNTLWNDLIPTKRLQAFGNIDQFHNDPRRSFQFLYNVPSLEALFTPSLAWAAGFFEGEGTTFTNRTNIAFRVVQSLCEPLEWFGRCVKEGKLGGPYSKTGMRPQGTYGEWINWHWTVFTNAESILEGMWPYLSQSKRIQAIKAWDIANQKRINKLSCRDFMYTDQYAIDSPKWAA